MLVAVVDRDDARLELLAQGEDRFVEGALGIERGGRKQIVHPIVEGHGVALRLLEAEITVGGARGDLRVRERVDVGSVDDGRTKTLEARAPHRRLGEREKEVALPEALLP